MEYWKLSNCPKNCEIIEILKVSGKLSFKRVHQKSFSRETFTASFEIPIPNRHFWPLCFSTL